MPCPFQLDIRLRLIMRPSAHPLRTEAPPTHPHPRPKPFDVTFESVKVYIDSAGTRATFDARGPLSTFGESLLCGASIDTTRKQASSGRSPILCFYSAWRKCRSPATRPTPVTPGVKGKRVVAGGGGRMNMLTLLLSPKGVVGGSHSKARLHSSKIPGFESRLVIRPLVLWTSCSSHAASLL